MLAGVGRLWRGYCNCAGLPAVERQELGYSGHDDNAVVVKTARSA